MTNAERATHCTLELHNTGNMADLKSQVRATWEARVLQIEPGTNTLARRLGRKLARVRKAPWQTIALSSALLAIAGSACVLKGRSGGFEAVLAPWVGSWWSGSATNSSVALEQDGGLGAMPGLMRRRLAKATSGFRPENFPCSPGVAAVFSAFRAVGRVLGFGKPSDPGGRT